MSKISVNTKIIRGENTFEEACESFRTLEWNEFKDSFNGSDTAFQKCYKDDLGKKYFLNAYLYDFERFRQGEGVGVQYEAQLTTIDGKCINISVSSQDWSIHEIESIIDNYFEKGLLEYYERI